MKVDVTLNTMNSGRIQVACIRSTNEHGAMGTGHVLAPFPANATEEVEAVLLNLGIAKRDIDLAMAYAPAG